MAPRRSLLISVAACALACCVVHTSAQTPTQTSLERATFHNPLLPSGPDPWVIADGGYYYFMATTGQNLTVRRTRDMADLANAEVNVVWTPPESGPYSKQIWAPELHKLDGKWYIYFAADDGNNANHRIYAIENASTNPLQGEWTFKGQVSDASNKWAIDATVFEARKQKYMVWSGWAGDIDGEQRIYIAHMRNPWTIDSPRTELSAPIYPWELGGGTLANPIPKQVHVNEGPEVLEHKGRVFLVYSASPCWTDLYELGMLQARENGRLLQAKSWTKLSTPVFRGDPAAGVYGPGHNGFFASPDGKQNWIIYHANSGPGQGCGGNRSPRIQPFTWKPDGTPDFGTPLSSTTDIKDPGSFQQP